MKYLLFSCHEEKTLDSMSKSECGTIMDETMAYWEALQKSIHLIEVEQLQPIQTAMTVRVRNGKLSVTDGPFAETKEQVGGFFLSTPEISTRPSRWPRSFHQRGSGAWRCGRSGSSIGRRSRDRTHNRGGLEAACFGTVNLPSMFQ